MTMERDSFLFYSVASNSMLKQSDKSKIISNILQNLLQKIRNKSNAYCTTNFILYYTTIRLTCEVYPHELLS